MKMRVYLKKTLNVVILSLVMVLASCTKPEKTEIEKDIDAINREDSGIRIYYYGKREELSDLNVIYVDSLEEIIFEKKYLYTYIVINNLDNLLTFDIEELIELQNKVVNNHYAFYYYGNKPFDQFYESGFIDEKHYIERDNITGFGYIPINETYINHNGIYTDDDVANSEKNESLFLERLIFIIKFVILHTR